MSLTRPLSIPYAIALATGVVAFSTGAGCAAAPGEGAAPDPVGLLREAAAAADGAPSLKVEFSVNVRVVMGENQDEQSMAFHYQAAEGDRFRFAPAPVEGAAPEGVLVAGNGKVTLTQLLSQGRFTLDENQDGFAQFVRSPLASGLGNGLGGLALSFLSSEAMEDLAADVTASEHLGVEQLDGKPHHHLRYTVEDSLVWEAWIAAEGKPLVRRILPDLSEMKAASAAAQQFDNFDYAIRFDYTAWETDAGLTADDFKITEPEGSIYMASFFEAPAEPPHPLLGKPAPAFELTNLQGESVNLNDHLGKDVVMIDFWATWCPPCIAALPRVDAVAKSFADRGVVFYAVNEQEDLATVQAFLDQRGFAPPVLLDLQSVAASGYLVEGLPTSVIIGRNGKVEVVHVGLGPDLETLLTTELDALADGESLADETIAKWNTAMAEQNTKGERLRALLD